MTRLRVVLGLVLASAVLSSGLAHAGSASSRAALSNDPTPPIPAPPVIVYAAPGDDGLDIWTTSAGTGLPINITNTRGISEGTPAWSPGGAKIAFVRYDGGGSGIWVMRADGTESDPLVESASKWLIDPTWSPDGTKIAFSQGTGNTSGIWVINVDSRRLYKVAEENNTRMLRPDWSPDGTKIVFERHVGLGRGQVWVINADGTGAAQRWAGGHGFDDFYDPAWSPNGKEIAFNGNPDGAVGGIMVMGAYQDAPRRQLTGGTTRWADYQAAWSTSGDQIVFTRYRSATSSQIYAVNGADGSQEQFIVDGSEPSTRRLSALAQLIEAKDRAGIQRHLSSLSIGKINSEVAALDQPYRDRLAEVILDFDAFSLPAQQRRGQLINAMRAALNKHQLGFYAEVWSYTHIETRAGGGGEFFCDSGRAVLGTDNFADNSVLRNTLLHESFHAFNCHENGPVGALNEGSAIWVFKEAFPTADPAQNWAEATYGTKLFYRDREGNQNYPLEVPVNPTAKLVEEFRYLSEYDGSQLPWRSQDKLMYCYRQYWESIRWGEPTYQEYLIKAEEATKAMLRDFNCSWR